MDSRAHPNPVTFATARVRADTQQSNVPAGLRPIHELLTSHGWTHPGEMRYHVTTRPGPSPKARGGTAPQYTCELTYIKDPTNDDEFRIRTTKDNVTVAVPIANAPYLYASSFKNYFSATEFVERHLATYESKMGRQMPT